MSKIEFEDPKTSELVGEKQSQLVMLAGAPGTGKTTLALEATASAIETGSVVYIDTGENFSPERFLQIGDKELLDRVNLLYPDTFQEQKSQVSALKSQMPNSTELIVVDSLVSLYRRQTDTHEIQDLVQDLSFILSELAEISREENIPVIVTGQVHQVESEFSLVGGEAPEFWPDRILELTEQGGFNQVKLVKNRFGDTGTQYQYKIKPQGIETQ